ncbi:acyltransferase domain-containing protein [Streptomyces xanthophaeus]|uniref:acyltransferase domain-containing protein n=1 Tax=Streptomyces xanthophaeus TaxID=67385 RepID=UPI00344957C9
MATGPYRANPSSGRPSTRSWRPGGRRRGDPRRLLLSWGVTPAEALGHSAGEVVAASPAGVFAVAEAVALVRGRVRGAVRIPPGGMPAVAVAASADELGSYLSGQVAVAAVNGERRTAAADPLPRPARYPVRSAHIGRLRPRPPAARGARRESAVLPMLPGDRPDRPERSAVLKVAAALWREGHDLTPDA